jgi:pimeloyl-ACP methyl ester carboxylesterase
MFETLMQLLAPDVPTIAFDTPGFGRSFDLEPDDTMANIAAWLLEAADDLGLARFHCFGHHAGACLALHWSDLARSRLISLGLCGPVIADAAERAAYKQGFSGMIPPDPEGQYLLETWRYVGGLGGSADLKLQHREVVANLRAYASRAVLFASVWDVDYARLLERVEVPILLLCSSDDVLIECHNKAHALRPDARVSLVGGYNYQTDLDVSGCAAAIRAFLQSLSPTYLFEQ